MNALLKLSALTCLIAAVADIKSASAIEPLSWDAERPLTWDDFSGPVPTSTLDEEAAMTAASLGWSYAFEIELSGNACLYWVTDVSAVAAFHPEASWSKPEHRTADVLEHEQGHFDIAQIHKLMFDAQTWELIGVARTCDGERPRRIEKYIVDEIERLLGSLYDHVWKNQIAVQAAYDEATRHGTDHDAQRRWLATIASGLRGHDWQAFDLVVR